jgi:hypothetical protein
MADRKPRTTPAFTLEDYHRLDMLAVQHALQEERELLTKLSVQHLREILVECGIESSIKDATYWSKADMVEAIAEHRVADRGGRVNGALPQTYRPSTPSRGMGRTRPQSGLRAKSAPSLRMLRDDDFFWRKVDASCKDDFGRDYIKARAKIVNLINRRAGASAPGHWGYSSKRG